MKLIRSYHGLSAGGSEDDWARAVSPDDDGSFRLDEVLPGPVVVSLDREDGEVFLAAVNVAPGAEADLGILDPNAPPTLGGCVTDAAGRPVAGAIVSLRLAPRGASLESVLTDRDGAFAIPRLVVPGAHIEIRCRGYGPRFLVVDGSLDSPVHIRLRPGGRLRIETDPGVPAETPAEWTIALLGGSLRFTPVCERELDEDGAARFLLTGLPDGPLRLEGSLFDPAGRPLFCAREVRVVAGETFVVVLVLRPE